MWTGSYNITEVDTELRGTLRQGAGRGGPAAAPRAWARESATPGRKGPGCMSLAYTVAQRDLKPSYWLARISATVHNAAADERR